ncbi:MAG: 5-bromo-4-chloroindolyl phosphate hydrolysis family protein, partial [Anaerovoracaceae bacterium]
SDRKLRSFLDYYLPTTLKMLRKYRDLERQEVRGENIGTTMRKIEEMMDKVTAGFEKQLDNLYQNDMLDITSDIAAMEQMMVKDGLSDDGELKF